MVCTPEPSDFFPVGRAFGVTIPEQQVREETLTVEAFVHPEVRLRSFRWSCVDVASVPYTSEFVLAGRVEVRTQRGFEVRLVDLPVMDTRVELAGDEATWVTG